MHKHKHSINIISSTFCFFFSPRLDVCSSFLCHSFSFFILFCDTFCLSFPPFFSDSSLHLNWSSVSLTDFYPFYWSHFSFSFMISLLFKCSTPRFSEPFESHIVHTTQGVSLVFWTFKLAACSYHTADLPQELTRFKVFLQTEATTYLTDISSYSCHVVKSLYNYTTLPTTQAASGDSVCSVHLLVK